MTVDVFRTTGGIVDAGPAYQKNLSDEVSKLQRLYGGGDMDKFPDFKFTGSSPSKQKSKCGFVLFDVHISIHL